MPSWCYFFIIAHSFKQLHSLALVLQAEAEDDAKDKVTAPCSVDVTICDVRMTEETRDVVRPESELDGMERK